MSVRYKKQHVYIYRGIGHILQYVHADTDGIPAQFTEDEDHQGYQ